MSVETLDRIKQQAEALSVREKSLLAEYLLEQIENEKHAKSPTDEAKRERRQAWIRANRQKYGGIYVALDGDHLLGTGRNYAEAVEAAKNAGITNAFVDFIAPPDYVGEIGGFE